MSGNSNYGQESLLGCKGKTLLGIVTKLFKTKMFVDITQEYFALLPPVNFPANNLNFTDGEGDRIQSRLSS